MKKKIVAANWKMNGNLSAVRAFCQGLNTIKTDHEVVFSPPYPYLDKAQQLCQNYRLCAQNASENTAGAYTGEVSMTMLTDFGCQYVILGHSERRTLYQEDDQLIFHKVRAAFDNRLTPILCIGETDKQNQMGETESVLAKQLRRVAQELDHKEKQQLVIAYEPVWAIGTGRTPLLEEIQDIHQKIRYLFCQNDVTISDSVRIVYGGSVNSDNAKAIFKCPDVDGGLVGGASLAIESFEKIIKAL